MSPLYVLVASRPKDVEAGGALAACRDAQAGVSLVADQVVERLEDIPGYLATVPEPAPCAVLLFGAKFEDVEQLTRPLLDARHKNQLVVCIHVTDRTFWISFRDRDMDFNTLFAMLRKVVIRPGDVVRCIAQRGARTFLGGSEPPPATVLIEGHAEVANETLLPHDCNHGTGATVESDCHDRAAVPEERTLMTAAMRWVQALVAHYGYERRTDVRQVGAVQQRPGTSQAPASPLPPPSAVHAADAALTEALQHSADSTEPLARLAHRLALTPLELKLVVLALAPELDTVYQHFFARLQHLDQCGVGTLGIYAGLLGDPVEVRQQLARSGGLVRWRLFENSSGAALPPGDEPLRLDRHLVDWLAGSAQALEHDQRLRRVLRSSPWPGVSLVTQESEVQPVARLLSRLRRSDDSTHWLLFNGDQTATWHATLERAAEALQTPPLRVLAHRVAALDATENDEAGARLARLARLTSRPLLLDTSMAVPSADGDPALRHLLGELAARQCGVGIVCTNLSWCVGLLSGQPIEVVSDSLLPPLARRRSLRTAAERLGVVIPEALLEGLEQQLPLQADGWERALALTTAQPEAGESSAQRTRRFITACREVASESISGLAQRIEPSCELGDIVLPDECRQQLAQIVASVRYARHVLDDWKFGEQESYGRGVCALFHGASGTGKSMSALAIARELESQVLRIDLSRVVSKYIGETEKHLDAVFRDAAKCGAVLLVDEADALLGKRGEIKDAHDRYAAQEVSYLLTRIESYDGVALFTTNARQNIDAAFQRRFRFIIEFPRPDVDAREDIWRRCLRDGSHELDPAAFRQLARKVDLTGGHIRQIALQAAFLAAAAKRKIGLAELATACRAELAKLGLPPIHLDAPPVGKAA